MFIRFGVMMCSWIVAGWRVVIGAVCASPASWLCFQPGPFQLPAQDTLSKPASTSQQHPPSHHSGRWPYQVRQPSPQDQNRLLIPFLPHQT